MSLESIPDASPDVLKTCALLQRLILLSKSRLVPSETRLHGTQLERQQGKGRSKGIENYLAFEVMVMHPQLAISYYNGLLELNVSRVVADGKIVQSGQVVSFMALRFHEDAPTLIKALESTVAPQYDVPELGLTGASLRAIFQKVYQQYARKGSKDA